MLSVLRTPIRHLQTTISVLLVLGLALIVFVVQRLSATEVSALPAAAGAQVAAANETEVKIPLARSQKAGPNGRPLPWVRWEYIP